MKTDAALQHNVMEERKWWPGVNEAHIGATAKDGVVALMGHVSHYAEKVAAEAAAKATGSVATWSERDAALSAAWSAPGATSVANELTIHP